MKKVSSVDEYINNNNHFKEGLTILRTIIKTTELSETLKWSAPVYTIDNKNVIGLGAFKRHFGIWFFNGVFLKDKHNVLFNAQEGKTKALRQWRFTPHNDINKTLVLDYIEEAIKNQKEGKILKPDRSKKETIIPIALQQLFNKNEEIKDSFYHLTPYKQREYCDYISTAKREGTQKNRLEKIKPMLLQGIGLNDKYKNC